MSEEQITYMLQTMYSTEVLFNQMQDGHQFILVKEEDHFIAFASYALYKGTTVYKLHKIYALPHQQGKGIGSFIINYILGKIKSAGATALQLNVNRHNKAKDFYEKLGFKIISEEDADIGNGFFMNDYVMEMKL